MVFPIPEPLWGSATCDQAASRPCLSLNTLDTQGLSLLWAEWVFTSPSVPLRPFPRAIITEYHNLGGLKQWKVKSLGVTGAPSGALRAHLSELWHLLAALSCPCPVHACPSLCLSSRGLLPVQLFVSKFSSLCKDTWGPTPIRWPHFILITLT